MPQLIHLSRLYGNQFRFVYAACILLLIIAIPAIEGLLVSIASGNSRTHISQSDLLAKINCIGYEVWSTYSVPARFGLTLLRRYKANCPESRGQFSHPEYCDLFLNCWDDEVIVGRCQQNLVFNERISACDYTYNVDCRGKTNTQEMTEPHVESQPGRPAKPPHNPPTEEITPAPVEVTVSTAASKPSQTPEPAGPAVATSTTSPTEAILASSPSVAGPSPTSETQQPASVGVPGPSPLIPAGTPTLSPTDPPPNTPATFPSSTTSTSTPPLESIDLKPKPEFVPQTPPTQKPASETSSTTSMPQAIPDLKPKPPFKPPQTTQSTTTTEVPPVDTVSNLKPRPPLKPVAEEDSQPKPPPLDIQDLKPKPPFLPPNQSPSPKPPNLNPDAFRPQKPPVSGGSTSTPPPIDGEDDPNILFPFLPQFPDTFKCPVETGILALRNDCESVIVCVLGIGHKLHCPKGETFDLGLSRCSPHRSLHCPKQNTKDIDSPNSNVLFAYLPASKLSHRN